MWISAAFSGVGRLNHIILALTRLKLATSQAPSWAYNKWAISYPAGLNIDAEETN